MSVTSYDMESVVKLRNSQGDELHAGLRKLSQTSILFEMSSSSAMVQLSEVVDNLCVTQGKKVMYEGQAVVCKIVDTGVTQLVSAILVEPLQDVDAEQNHTDVLRNEAEQFVSHWKESNQIVPEFRNAVGEMRFIMEELNGLCEYIDMEMEKCSVSEVKEIKNGMFTYAIDSLFEQFKGAVIGFEAAARKIPKEDLSFHRKFIQADLHPLVMRSPFAYRTYRKPLGYAGDYEMVNMMLRDPMEGASTYAEFMNSIFIKMEPAEAHRNRIDILVDYLNAEYIHRPENDTNVNILNVACGPAAEVQRFISNNADSNYYDFTLLDFNSETLQYTEAMLKDLCEKYDRNTSIEFIQASVYSLLKSGAGLGIEKYSNKFDFIYCAGLFDYLSDKVCRKLLIMFNQWVKPGGKLVVTNVHPKNAVTNWIEHVLEWYLIYRDEEQLLKLAPELGQQRVFSDETGVNIFLEITKEK